MRALLSWDINPSDPELQQMVLELGAVLPPGRVVAVTNHSVIVDPITTNQFSSLFNAVDSVADRYAGRLFFVFSLHPSNSPIWARPRPSAPSGVGEPPQEEET